MSDISKKEEHDANEQSDVQNASDEQGKSKKRLTKKKKIIIIVAAAVILVAGGIGGFLFYKNKQNAKVAKSSTSKSATTKAEVKEIYVNLDEFLVNLTTDGDQSRFLKMSVTLQVSSEDIVKKVEAKMPLIRDIFTTYLRELRADDLQGSAGIYRLREELQLRLNKIMYPDQISDILFREVLVQ
jgi:flagellar FliL protein